MELASNSKYSITPEKVRKDNTDIWKYSTILARELRKENFKKHRPEDYINYCDAANLLVEENPYEHVDFHMDIEKFKLTLSPVDVKVLDMYLLGMKAVEMEVHLDRKRVSISNRINSIIAKFRIWYLSGEIETELK